MTRDEMLHKIASLENTCELLEARVEVELVAKRELDRLLEKTFAKLATCQAVNRRRIEEAKGAEQ